MGKQVKNAELWLNHLLLEISGEKNRNLVAKWVPMVCLNVAIQFVRLSPTCNKQLQRQWISYQVRNFIMDSFPIVFNFVYLVCEHLLVAVTMHLFSDFR